VKFLKRVTVIILFALIAGVSVAGQTATGEVNGTVSDPNGAAVPGAVVTLIDQATKVQADATSNQSGHFIIVNLKPATYTLMVEARGFKKLLTNSFVLGVSETLTKNVVLSLGEMSEVVEVSTASELVQSSSSELGTVINERTVEDLPLNGRNFTQLLTLTPGVTPVSTSQNKSIGGVEGNVGIPGSGFVDPSFHGMQNRSKLYFFDGIINTNVRGPTYIVIPNIDAVQEFKVVGQDAKAEFGGAMGGDMNMVERILTAAGTTELFRAYLGYSGWGPGQLENEMKTGSWITLPADPALLFEKDPARVWGEILLSLGEEYRLYAEMPFDPSYN
jgi:hypothetical protein